MTKKKTKKKPEERPATTTMPSKGGKILFGEKIIGITNTNI